MASRKTLKDRRRTDYAFRQEYRTRWLDNDVYGHMNNAVYLTLFDSIINAYLMQFCGRIPTKSNQNGFVAHSQCDFFGPVGYPSVLELGLKVTQIGKSSATYEVGVFEKGHPDVKAVGGYTHVFVDRKKRKPKPEGMPQQVRDGLTKLLTKPSAKL